MTEVIWLRAFLRKSFSVKPMTKSKWMGRWNLFKRIRENTSQNDSYSTEMYLEATQKTDEPDMQMEDLAAQLFNANSVEVMESYAEELLESPSRTDFVWKSMEGSEAVVHKSLQRIILQSNSCQWVTLVGR